MLFFSSLEKLFQETRKQIFYAQRRLYQLFVFSARDTILSKPISELNKSCFGGSFFLIIDSRGLS